MVDDPNFHEIGRQHQCYHLKTIGPSGVRAPVQRSGHYTGHYFSLSLSSLQVSAKSQSQSYCRVKKNCMGSKLTKILGFKSTTKTFGEPPNPRTMTLLGGQGGYFQICPRISKFCMGS